MTAVKKTVLLSPAVVDRLVKEAELVGPSKFSFEVERRLKASFDRDDRDPVVADLTAAIEELAKQFSPGWAKNQRALTAFKAGVAALLAEWEAGAVKQHEAISFGEIVTALQGIENDPAKAGPLLARIAWNNLHPIPDALLSATTRKP